MSLTDLFTTGYVYNTASKQWINRATGRFVSPSALEKELKSLADESKATLKALTQQLYAGEIDLAEWGAAVAGELKDAHLANAMFARGGRDFMGSEEFGRVGGNLGDEYRHLNDFAEGIQDGSVSEAQALNRIGNYGDAATQSYSREWALLRDRPEWDDLPCLDQVPRDGNTQCHGNCNCTLREGPDGIHWDLNPGESCDDCKMLAEGGPYKPCSV